VLVITAQRHRTQERNRQDALDRLVALIRRACPAANPAPPPTQTQTAAAKRRRLQAKARRAAIKELRRAEPDQR